MPRDIKPSKGPCFSKLRSYATSQPRLATSIVSLECCLNMIKFNDSEASTSTPFSSFALRQVSGINNCVLNSSGTNIERTCDDTDYKCLCAQSEPDTFADWVLDTVCNICDGADKLGINPISALASYCPAVAMSRQGIYSCQHFTSFLSFAGITTTIASTRSSQSSFLVTTDSSVVISVGTEANPSSAQTQLQFPSSLSSSVQIDTISNLTTIITAMVSTSAPATISSATPSSYTASAFSSTLSITPSSTQPISSAPPSPFAPEEPGSNTLSTRAKVGIGIAAAIGFLLVCVLIYIAVILHCKRQPRTKIPTPLPPELGPGLLPEIDAATKPSELPGAVGLEKHSSDLTA